MMMKPEAVSCDHCFMEPRCWPESAAVGADGMPVERQPALYPGSTLWRHGAAFSGLYIVRSGCIKVMETDETGGERVLSFAFAGDMIGLEALASGRHETTAVALTEAMVCFLAWPLRAAGTEAALTLRLLQRASTLLLQRTRAVRLADPDQSVQRFLRDVAARIGREESSGALPAVRVRLPMSRMEIGQYLGYAEETVCRSMHRLRRQGEIEVSGRTLLMKSKGSAHKPMAAAAIPGAAPSSAPR